MPFSPFVGVNHHGSTIIFAAALISYEDTESFVWVFEKWIECMGRAPNLIITDQDKAMEAAIRRVFPGSKHRLCLWHILQNADRNLRSHPRFTSLDRELRATVHESFTEDEFMNSWHEMVVKYDLQQNTWINESYAIRRKWVPAYWMDTFCAGMSSTQRSEQVNRFFKGFVSVETGLRKFIEQYEFGLKRKVEEEERLNYTDKERPLKWDERWLVEEVFHKVYTNKKFQEVKDELYACIGTHIEALPNSHGFIKRYKASSTADNPFWKKDRRYFQVSIDTLTNDYKCGCKLFEFKGILCRHIIKCINILNVTSIPVKYILDRWRKDVVRGYENIHVGYYNPQESDRVKRYIEVNVVNDYAGQLAMNDNEALNLYKTKMKDVIAALEAHVGVETVKACKEGQNSTRLWGRRRVQRKERVTHRTEEGKTAIGDPPNKRGPGRRRVTKQPKRRKMATPNTNPIPQFHTDNASSQMSGFSSSQLRDSQLPHMSSSQNTAQQSNSQFTSYSQMF
ncbi:hypothetical protein RND81_11G177800 [Saponaria officinalis]|uniref:Protein FAR1-RELATED SEQUENCE n=1 Tax=Saponaria officinalis TaxID=3572 RepID=A0AAW1HMJ8_SAPOF